MLRKPGKAIIDIDEALRKLEDRNYGSVKSTAMNT